MNELMHFGGLSLIRRRGGGEPNKEAERNCQSCVFWCDDAVWDCASLGSRNVEGTGLYLLVGRGG